MLRLRQERLKKGWTLLDVAYRTQIGPSVISEVERGRRKAYPSWEHRLVMLFKIPAKDLFQEIPDD